jgi:hypothetical protein
MANVTVRWYVDGEHDPDDPKETTANDFSDAEWVVRTIAEKWWHKSGDYSTAFDIVVVAPAQFVGRYPVEVESVPHFVVGKPQ